MKFSGNTHILRIRRLGNLYIFMLYIEPKNQGITLHHYKVINSRICLLCDSWHGPNITSFASLQAVDNTTLTSVWKSCKQNKCCKSKFTYNPGMGRAQKIHPDYSLINTRPEIECSRALVCTVSSHVNKNGGLRERNIHIKIVVKPIQI